MLWFIAARGTPNTAPNASRMPEPWLSQRLGFDRFPEGLRRSPRGVPVPFQCQRYSQLRAAAPSMARGIAVAPQQCGAWSATDAEESNNIQLRAFLISFLTLLPLLFRWDCRVRPRTIPKVTPPPNSRRVVRDR